MITVQRYRNGNESAWNTFIAASSNATFILDRRYMDYHKDRFSDHSLMLYESNKLIALFPANEKGGTIYSHGGLTYGGLIVGKTMKLLTTLSSFYAITSYYYHKGFKKILYKPVPSFFHSTPYYQDNYALFRLDARLTTMNTGFAVDLKTHPSISKRRLRMVEKAKKNHIHIEKAVHCLTFWNDILIPHLKDKFHTNPVHTAGEIELLRRTFPKNIVQYNAILGKSIIAGTTLFIDRNVVHVQYIASSDIGRSVGALDYLFGYLMTKTYKSFLFFSFGTTNMGSTDGRALSRGLVEWKEGFDAHMFPYPWYTIETKNYKALGQYI
jgi:hypothetical protein